MQKALIILFLAGSMNASCSDLYSYVFGNQNVSSDYDVLTRQALKDLGVCDYETVPVKKMNGTARKLLGEEFHSFTLWGIWLNEEILNQCSAEEKIFSVYHEASHYYLMHHTKILLGTAVSIPAFIKALVYCNSLTQNFSGILQKSGLVCLTGLGSYLYIKLFLKYYKSQEKAADIHAAKILCSIGKKDAVIAHVAGLKRTLDSGFSNPDQIWFPDLREQYNYLNIII